MDPIYVIYFYWWKIQKIPYCWRNIFWKISTGKTESQPQCAMPLIPLGHALLIFCCRTGICHTYTHTLGPFRPLTSAKWQLHQGGHGSSKKTIAFSVNEHAYVSDEAFIIYPNKIFSFFLFFLKSVFSSGSLEKDLAVVFVVALHPLTPFLSQSKGIKHGHRREKFPIAKSFMQLRWALQRFFCPIQMSWSKQKKKTREVSFRAIG